MVMQMLQAGGMDVLTDGVREADEGNPRGYFEFEASKRLQTDRTWLGKAVNKAVKIVVQLLPYLPLNFEYRVLLVHRNLDEVVKSQSAMLDRENKKGAQLSPDTLKRVYSRQLSQVGTWLRASPQIRLLELTYGDIISDPQTATSQIQVFTNRNLNWQRMAEAVVPNLHRQRGS